MKNPLSTMFSAKWWQVTTYLLFVALFSISFLVFLNSSISFVVTDLIGRKHGAGDAVGTLGFADELVALVACPIWGLLSDRLGVRLVCVFGYAIIGVSLFVLVQARNVYPQLLLARLLFSVGGAAVTTMVTAILPSMASRQESSMNTARVEQFEAPNSSRQSDSQDVTASATVERLEDSRQDQGHTNSKPNSRPNPSRVAGLVGMFTGIGALVALGLFLPLPKRLQDAGNSPAEAITHSFYIVGAVAFVVSIICGIGLRDIAGERHKGLRYLFGQHNTSEQDEEVFISREKTISYAKALTSSICLGFQDMQIGLAYLGGFVARSSSVGVSLFISLYVNNYFKSTGLCNNDPHLPPSEINTKCRRAYVLAAELSGISQLIALLAAPLFGYLDGRYRRLNAPLLIAAIAGVVGYASFSQLRSPDPKSEEGSPAIFLIMALLGISQIGAIVCSLSLLGRGIEGPVNQHHLYKTDERVDTGIEPITESSTTENSALLPSHLQLSTTAPSSRTQLKGSIAGIYSLSGGVGILLLTKLGGHLFDVLSPAAPFYMLAIFNAILLAVGLICVTWNEIRWARHKIEI